jgi:carboxyl-terminal processing protease
VSEISDGAAIKLSVFYFLTPNKTRIDGYGIVPDFIIHNSGKFSDEELVEMNDALVPMTESVRYYAGDIGLNVYAAQQRLKYMDYDVDLTAVMDEKMLAAVKKFQAENGLYSYGALDFTTTKAVANVFNAHINPTDQDLQLDKALEILNK